MKKRVRLIIISLLFFVSLSLPLLSFAAPSPDPLGKLKGVATNGGYKDATETSFSEILGIVVQTFLSLLGIIFIILMLYAGYNWMTASGDQAKVDKAQKIIWRSILGLIIVIGAFAIWNFIFKNFVGDYQANNDVFIKTAYAASTIEYDSSQEEAFFQNSGYQSNSDDDLSNIINIIIKTFLSLLGLIFLILILTAGYNWMTAGGDEAKVKKARETILRASIGLLIIVSAYTITYFVFTNIDATSPSSGAGAAD